MHCRHPLIRSSVVAVTAFSLLAAGCGGGGGAPGVARIASSTTSTTTRQNGAVAYAGCMRSHGLSNFPDPNGSGEFAGNQLKSLRFPGSQVRAADGACHHLLPNGLRVGPPPQAARDTRTRIADALSLARCMRRHGLTPFPDPTARGELSVEMVQDQGIDVHSPAVLQVVRACLPASHGALTPAMVREALRNARG